MLPSFRIMGKSAPALTRAFRATACRSAVVGSTADAKVTKDLGTAYPIGLPYSSPAHAWWITNMTASSSVPVVPVFVPPWVCLST